MGAQGAGSAGVWWCWPTVNCPVLRLGDGHQSIFRSFFSDVWSYKLGSHINPRFWPAYPIISHDYQWDKHFPRKPRWSFGFSPIEAGMAVGWVSLKAVGLAPTQRAMQGVQVELSWMPRFWNFIRLRTLSETPLYQVLDPNWTGLWWNPHHRTMGPWSFMGFLKVGGFLMVLIWVCVGPNCL